MLNCPGKKLYILRISSSINWHLNVLVLKFSVRTSRMRAGTGIQLFIPQIGSGRAAVMVSVILNPSFSNRGSAAGMDGSHFAQALGFLGYINAHGTPGDASATAHASAAPELFPPG